MVLQKVSLSIASAVFVLSLTAAGVASALTTSCVGVPSSTNVTWTASSAGGIAPVAFLWGNGGTSSVQTISVTSGVYSMTLQGTDASSTVATSTCSATVVASTGTDIQSQIQALLAQIATLKAQIVLLLQQQSGNNATSTPPTANGDCFQFNRDLHQGDDGDDVKELQQKLSSDPTILPPGLITGFFGPRTEEALKKFQEKFGIASTGTGFFGPKSREHLRSECSSGDNDHDGISNANDSDDDNDGIPDVTDPRPFVFDSSASSTLDQRHNGDNEKKGGNGQNSRDD